MSFQHFRLGAMQAQPLPPHLAHQGAMANLNGPQNSVPQFAENSNNSFNTNPPKSHTSTAKQPYGSGDADDYNLIFPSIEAFNEWRRKEEETQMVEFVKGDTHGSKAVPPRFKDHTKLLCARHSRSGRKKYVKKHPERVRKVPSRKLEGQGCPASISFKTYFDTDEVRACYNSQHSHEIGLANLPFTRRGRKAAVEQDKERTRKQPKFDDEPLPDMPPEPVMVNAIAGPSHPQAAVIQPQQQQMNQHYSPAVMIANPQPQPQPVYQQQQQQPQQQQPQQMQNHFGYTQHQAQGQFPSVDSPMERWNRMGTIFNSVHLNSRTFEYPAASVAALEACLLRLYLETPVPGANLHHMPQQQHQQMRMHHSRSMNQMAMSNDPHPGRSDASGSDESG
ncbi:hypothetical protein C8J56DRAFT_850201 [Mycena floridula]|nr:hypothetical protein C8J56DRAFT_850201 [Mycena floridula]